MGMSATVDSKTVNPASPSKITVKVRAASNANTGDVTVTPVVPEGWEIKPGSVSLKSIPAGKAAIAYFNVVNTTGTGDATVQFKLTNTKTGEELGTTSVALTGSLTKDVEASDYAASSQETTGEHAPVATPSTRTQTRSGTASTPTPAPIFRTGWRSRRRPARATRLRPSPTCTVRTS